MRRTISSVLAILTIQWAIFWLAPSARFNIVEADDNIKGQTVSHSYTVQAQLKAADDYLEGLDRLLHVGVPLTDSTVKAHLGMLSKDATLALKKAKVHATELSSVVSTRVPASSLGSGNDLLSKVHRGIDLSIQGETVLSGHLQDDGYLSNNRKTLEDELSNLRKEIRKTLNDERSLEGQIGA